MYKQPEVTEATRNAFLDAFCDLAQKKPVSAITVREITEMAGYNRTTFYRYFKDVYALLDYLEDELMDLLLSGIKEGEGELLFDDGYFLQMQKFLHQNRSRIRVVINDRNRSHFILKLERWMVHNQMVHLEDSYHNTMVMTIYFSGVFAALTTWLNTPENIDNDEFLTIIHRLFTDWYLPELTVKKSEKEGVPEKSVAL